MANYYFLAAFLVLTLQAGAVHCIPTSLATLIQESQGFRPSTLVLRGNITMTAPLPNVPFSANITLKGGCGRYRCIIDGRSKFAVFVTTTIGCAITLENVEFRNIQGGVVRGACSVYVRNSVFRNCSNANGGVFQLASLSEGAQIIGSTFLNNKASSNGGAIFYGGEPGPQSGTSSVYITRSSFIGNTAGGNGGALSLSVFAANIYLKQVAFRFNKAGRDGGGALLVAESSNARLIGTRFERNVAVNGAGGGLALEANYGSTLHTLCNATFLGNKAPRANRTYNVRFLNGDSSGGRTELRFCKARPLGVVVQSRRDIGVLPNATIVTTSCVECTGCTNDCSGQGSCTFNGFGVPSCACRGNRKAADNCASCLFGYSGAACTTCLPGFTKTPQGKCVICRGLDRLEVDSTSYTKAAANSTINKCRGLCRNSSVYCTFWALLDKGSACPGTCVLFGDNDICSKGNITFNPTYKIFSQKYQLGKCDD